MILRNADGTFKKGIHPSRETEFKKGQRNYWQGKTGGQASNWKGGLPNCQDCGKKLSTHKTLRCKICFYKTRNKTLGLSKNTFYHLWIAIRDRCSNPKNHSYEDYGGRGIKLCKKWQTFGNFYKDMYPTYQKGLTIDRIDNNGNYEPTNCRWSTYKMQANNRRNTIFIEFYGIRDTLQNWADFFKLSYATLYQRIFIYKWPLEKAFWTTLSS